MTTEQDTAREKLELLYHISRELATAIDLRSVLLRVLSLSLSTVGGDRASIVVLDDRGHPLDAAIVYGSRVMEHTTQQLRETVDRGLAGWVVRNFHYAIGLRDWYVSQGIIPGSIIHIRKSKTPGEVFVWADKKRPAREWIRTALVGSDNKITFAMLKQLIVAAYDERMSVAIPDPKAVDGLWDSSTRSTGSTDQFVRSMMIELSKLNPQGHVLAL